MASVIRLNSLLMSDNRPHITYAATRCLIVDVTDFAHSCSYSANQIS